MSDALAAPSRNLTDPVSIIVLGASGDLARRKVIPALFALYCQKLLPAQFRVVGYARSHLSHEEFRNRITEHLTCRYVPGESCEKRMEDFLSHCFYVSGGYDDRASFANLREELRKLEGANPTNRIFYLAIPPFVFLDVAQSLRYAGLVSGPYDPNWSRAVIEKPFGSDRATSDDLVRNMADVFTESQTYRIDHYLGKEVIQNLMVLRFANLIFDPIWNRAHVDNVQISWKEDLGIDGRGGYFNEYGIIRDVMQNHLLQIMALIAMEQPVSLQARDVRDEKVKLLRSIAPVKLEDMVLGQYGPGVWKGKNRPGYRQEESIPSDSRTPTYAAAVLHATNRRWAGVPFLIQAGKGLNARKTEIRIQFREVPANLYLNQGQPLARNQLVIRVQPDESITFQIMNKTPGLEMRLGKTDLNLRYGSTFKVEIPDAYECLLLDVMEGNESLFIRSDELAAAWDIFTPVLHEIDRNQIEPDQYPFGTNMPSRSLDLAARYGAEWHED